MNTSRYKWDYITDTCSKCGIVKMSKQLYITGELMRSTKPKWIEYFIDGKWVDKAPNCV